MHACVFVYGLNYNTSGHHFVDLQRFIYTLDIPMYTQFLSVTQEEVL